MLIIAHRGLMHGPDKALENHPAQIEKALDAGLDVEVDAWVIDGAWWLGHDKPTHQVNGAFLSRTGVWVHCKNLDALRMATPHMHYFWHDQDAYTLTSRGVIWCYPKSKITNSNSVMVLPEWQIADEDIAGVLLDYHESGLVPAICTDYAGDVAARIRAKAKEDIMRIAMESMSK